MRPLRNLPLYQALGLALALFIVYGSLTPNPPKGPDIPDFDKWEHLLAYGLLMAWWGQLAQGRKLRAALAMAFMALGGVLELAQGAMAMGRTMEFADVAANVLGVWMGYMFTKGKGGEILRNLER